MTPSVSPEAEWELTDGALFYAREGGAELGLAFITEFVKNARPFHAPCATWCAMEKATEDGLYVGFHTPSSTMSEATNYAWLRWLIIAGNQSIGRAGSRLRSNNTLQRTRNSDASLAVAFR